MVVVLKLWQTGSASLVTPILANVMREALRPSWYDNTKFDIMDGVGMDKAMGYSFTGRVKGGSNDSC